MNVPAFFVLGVLMAGGLLAWQWSARPLALGLGSFAAFPAATLFKDLMWPAVALIAVVGLVTWLSWSGTSATVTRWGARSRRKSGVASSLDIARKASSRAMHAKATTIRPSLASVSRRARRRVLASELGVLLCRVGAQQVWSSLENVVLVFGGPRMGKSGWLASRILDAPGTVLATSTRTDLVTLTGEVRRARGPVFVFNPVGLGGAGFTSTITFDPLTGCQSPVAAMERATDMVAATVHHGPGGGDRAFWESQARRVLAALLHAAALGGFSMHDVLDWVSRPDSARDQLTSVLRRSPEPGFVEEVSQFLATNDRTRTSITSSIMPTLGWLTSSTAVHAATGGHAFDVGELLESRATVYLLGAEETHTAPLVCALTGHIAREARRIAAHQPSGRLDPPLTLALDEAALISPVPLDRWSADMGGRGVCIVAAFQSRSQLIDRYGEARAATTINNAGAKVIFGGTGDRDDLHYWSALAGERDEPVETTDLHGQVLSRTVRRVPVLAPAQLSQLPPHRVVVFTAGMPPVVGRADRAWRRPDVRAVLQPRSTSVRIRAMALSTRSTALAWLFAPARLLAALVVRAWRCVLTIDERTSSVRAEVPTWAEAPSAPPWTAEVIPFPISSTSSEGRGGPPATSLTEWPRHSGPDGERGRGRWN